MFDYLGNTWKRLENKEMLTDRQREAFGKLMKVYVKNKSTQYDRLYDNMQNVFELNGIPKEYLPRRASEDAKRAFDATGSTTQQTGTDYAKYIPKNG